ncbi:hypothetical protein IWQ49_003931 [Labrenzia sp. EL_126]|nr:hypothetical protein [Labrenzia sp. EL_126]
MVDKVVKNPTYFEHIRHFFDAVDLDHMQRKGIDLSTYEGLKTHAMQVLFQTEPPNANMPPAKERQWTKQRWETFKNWITTGHPLGVPKPIKAPRSTPDRLRRDLDSINADEIDKLTRAFKGIMALDRNNPNSYFALAGIHWYPDKSRCQHRVDKYHPWHRAYLLMFENALRTIEGCEDITLPYWDVTKPPPSFLFKRPFSKYRFPIAVSPDPAHQAGQDTIRNPRSVIIKELADYQVSDFIAEGLAKPVWNDFNNYRGRSVVGAHDAGHAAMAQFNSDVASFDPIFWFFHSYWDKLWWDWQQAMGATDYWGFRSTVQGSTLFLEPGFDTLEPFPETVRQVLDSHDLGMGGVGYDTPVSAAPEAFTAMTVGSTLAINKIRVGRSGRASVRVKNINRLKIPGGFDVLLKADKKVVGRRFLFQSSNPNECDNCKASALVDLDFETPVDAVMGKELSVELHVRETPNGLDTRFPLHSAGDPTINVRLLMD